MKKHIKLTITVPIVDRGNYDVICDALDTCSRRLDLNDMCSMLNGIPTRNSYHGRIASGTIKMEVVEE